VQRLNTDLNAVLNDPVVKDKLQTLGIDASPGSPEQFADQLRRDLGRYGQVVKAANIRLE
jgi:tripartite-type tricarboxylate transporter receptor subunit TctC